MAHGRRRVWAGAGLVGLGVLAGAAVVASRWYWLTFNYPDPASWTERVVGLSEGRLHWTYSVNVAISNKEGYRFVFRSAPSHGPVLLLPDISDWFERPGCTGFQWMRLCYHITTNQYRGKSFAMVAWPIPLVLLGLGVVPLWSGVRQRRRWKHGRCLRCGYDLRATPAAAPCPECGGVRGAKAG